MNKKELFRTVMIQFFICYTLTMLVTVVFAKLNTPDVTEISVNYIWEVAVFSLFAELPSLLYYSKNELSRRQWWVRTVIHTVLIEVVLMTAGYIIGMYKGILGSVAFFFTVLAVDVLVRLFSYLADMTTADTINRKLKERRIQTHEAQKDEK